VIVAREKIKALVDTMPTREAERLLSYIVKNFQTTLNVDLWDAIEEVEPDEIDVQMLHEMKNDPDCHDFT